MAEMLIMPVHIMIRIKQNFLLCLVIVIVSLFVMFVGGLDTRKPFHLFLCLILLTTAVSDATFLNLPFGLGSTGLQLSDVVKAVVFLPFIPQ